MVFSYGGNFCFSWVPRTLTVKNVANVGCVAQRSASKCLVISNWWSTLDNHLCQWIVLRFSLSSSVTFVIFGYRWWSMGGFLYNSMVRWSILSLNFLAASIFVDPCRNLIRSSHIPASNFVAQETNIMSHRCLTFESVPLVAIWTSCHLEAGNDVIDNIITQM